MSPEVGRGIFRIPIFLLVCSIVLLWLEPRGSAEFSITVVTLIVALVFIAALALVLRIVGR
jgi:uncharacterized membrane protein YhhN